MVPPVTVLKLFQVFENHFSVGSLLPIWRTAGFRGQVCTLPEKGGAVRATSCTNRQIATEEFLLEDYFVVHRAALGACARAPAGQRIWRDTGQSPGLK